MTGPTRRSFARTALDAVAIVALVVAASLSFGGAYGGTRWLVAAAGGAVIGAAVALLVARLRWPWWSLVPAVAAAYLIFGAALALPGTAVAGVLPSIDSLRLLTVGVVTSWRQLLTVAVPVGTAGAVLIPVYLAALVLSAIGTTIAVRTTRPLFALAAPLAMLVVAALFGATTAWLPIVAGAAVAIGGLLWASWRGVRGHGVRAPGDSGAVRLDLRRPVSAIAVLAAALAAAGYFGPSMATADRFALRETVQQPFDPQQFPSPLVGFRSYFKDQRDTDLLTVTGLPAGARIRLATLDVYDGVTYDASTTLDPFLRVGEQIDDPAIGTPATMDVTIEGYRGVYLPIGGHLTGLTFDSADAASLRDGLRYSPGNAAAVVVGGVREGDRYTAQVVVPPAASDLDPGTVAVQSVALPAPGRISDEIKTTAGTLTENASTTYDKIVAVQQGLSTRGFLSHGTEGEETSASGHGLDRITRLLGDTEMVGDQEQFAPAMALMLRARGIPARVVMGFAPADPADPGDPGDPAGEATTARTLRGSDVTAWVEVPFSGVGWVAFDPTPDDQRTELEPDPEPQVAPRAQVLQPPPPPQPPQDAATDNVDQGNTDDRTTDQQNDQPTATGDLAEILLRVAAWVGLPLLIVGGPIALVLWLKARRRRRRRQAPVLAHRISGGWHQILDHASDLGYRVPQGRTRTETAVDLDRQFGADTALLARRADARVFGPEDIDDQEAERFWTEVDAALLGLDAGCPPWRRWVAAVSPASLRRRRPGPR